MLTPGEGAGEEWRKATVHRRWARCGGRGGKGEEGGGRREEGDRTNNVRWNTLVVYLCVCFWACGRSAGGIVVYVLCNVKDFIINDACVVVWRKKSKTNYHIRVVFVSYSCRIRVISPLPCLDS